MPMINKDLFISVPISKILPETALCVDIYLLIDDKFIKFKNEGDTIPSEKFNFFLSKGLKEFYIEKDKLSVFANWIKITNEKEIEKTVRKTGEPGRKLVEKREELKEKIYETFADQELTQSTVYVIQNTVNNILEEVSKNKMAAMVLAKLTKQNQSISDHSINTANLAVFMAMTLGHGHHYVLENIYLGALFHDYAKSKLSASVLENPKDIKYSQAIQDHPRKGCEALRQINGIPEQVLTIVEQHHEQFNGKGYPKGLKKDEIYNLSKIVSIANVFDNTLTENRMKTKNNEMYKIAIKVLEYDRGKQFDQIMIERIAKAMRIVYGC